LRPMTEPSYIDKHQLVLMYVKGVGVA